MLNFIKYLIQGKVFGEFKSILSLAWPIVLMNLFRFINPTVSVIMCGHLSKIEFDAASLANSLINVFGVSIDLGFSTACDTLFAQIYGGKNRRKLGLMLQRSMIVMTLIYLLLCCVHLNVEPILIWLQQDAEISRLTARYVAIYLPGLFFDFQFLTISRYLQNQNIVYPMMISAFAGTVFNALSQYIALYVLGYRIDASAILQAVGCFVMFSIQLGYVLVSKVYKSTWQGIEWRKAMEAWGIFFKLGIPGIVMIGVEEWTFEIGNFLAGSLSITQLGAQSIAFNTEFFCYNIHIGLAIAAAIRCGQFLGSNQPIRAALCAKVVILTDLGISIITAIALLSLRYYIPFIFTDESDIRQLAEKIIIILAVIQLFDAGCSSTAGIFRACGRQMNGAIVMSACYYLLGIPLGLVLIYLVKMDISGFWIALLSGLAVEVVIYMILLYRIDWEAEARKAKLNEQSSKLSTTESPEFTDKEKLLETETKNYQSIEESNETSNTNESTGKLAYKGMNLAHRRSISGSVDVLRSWATDCSDRNLKLGGNDNKDLPITFIIHSRSNNNKIVFQKIMILLAVCCIFIGSLVLSFCLPRKLYLPCIPVGNNSRNYPSLDKHYPFCNDTIYL